jgi:peptidoglycan/xylan/chitin deacetylase (PgdA/CDA1 family)
MSTQDTLEDKVVYFTFDDGPSQTYTPLVLNILRKEGVPATFFVVGSRANEAPFLIRRIRKEGHELGNHGYSHNYFRDISVGQLEYEVRTTDRTIQRICGVIPYYFRPPGGIMSPDGYKALHRLGHHAVLWTVDSRDHKSVTYREIVENVMRQVRPGSVILFHDGISKTRHTIQALPILIHDLRMQGYRFQVLPIGGATTFKVY